MRTMQMYKLLWTALYMPGHEHDPAGDPRIVSDDRVSFSAMWTEIRLERGRST